MSGTELTQGRAGSLAQWLTALDPDSGASTLTMTVNELLAAIWNALDGNPGASHLLHTENEMLAGIWNALDANAVASHLTHSTARLLAGIVNVAVEGVNVSHLTSSVDELYSLLSGGGGGFDLVRDVFGGGAYAGFYYDFTSLTQIGGLDPMYTTSPGETPVAANGNTIGLALSQDSGPTVGAELVTNGTFSVDTSGWVGTQASLAAVSGQLVVTGTGATSPRATGSVTGLVVGGLYRASIQQVGGSIAGTVRIGVSDGNSAYMQKTTAGTHVVRFVATSTTAVFTLYTANGETSIWDNVSLKRIAGNHASQPTVGSRGTWSSDGYWLGDGSDDHLITGLVPGNDTTIIAAIYPTAASDAVAGTMAASDTRSLGFGTDASGNLTLMLGDASLSTSAIKGSTDIRNTWSVASAIGAGTTGTLRRNGAQIATGAVGGSINTTIAYLLGAFNSNGTAAATLAGRIARMLIVKRSNMSAALLANAEKAIGAGFVSL